MIQKLLDFFNPLDYVELWLFVAFALAFVVSYFTFPTIFHVAREKHLMDEPGERSIHSTKTPTLGGIGIYLSLVVVITTIGAFLNTKILLLILGGMTILFFLGLKDDLLILSPRKKFFGQLMAAAVLIIFTNTRITGLSGFFGITLLPYWISVLFTLFVYILIINAYNLIDGVDGLAGTLALFASSAFAYIFVQNDDVSIATIAVALVGALLPFLRHNLSKNNKIFMGDTGSLIVGFLIAFFAVRFIGQTQMQESTLFADSAPIIALAIIFFPLLDTLRIFFIRLVIHKKSPFLPDKNHLHHRFLDIGLTHIQTTLTVVVLNAVIVASAYFLRYLDIHIQFILLLLIGTLLYSGFFLYHKIFKYKTNSKVSEQLN